MSSFATEMASRRQLKGLEQRVVVGGREQLASRPRLARAEIDRSRQRLHVDPRARLDDELIVRLLHREVVDRVAEVVLALRIHGRRRIDQHGGLERSLPRMAARCEVQHVVRHRYDVLVGKRGAMADVVHHRGDSSRRAPAVRFGDE